MMQTEHPVFTTPREKLKILPGECLEIRVAESFPPMDGMAKSEARTP
jgi:hypothetical protein